MATNDWMIDSVENQVENDDYSDDLIDSFLRCSPGAGPLFVKKDGNHTSDIAYRISHIAKFQHDSGCTNHTFFEKEEFIIYTARVS